MASAQGGCESHLRVGSGSSESAFGGASGLISSDDPVGVFDLPIEPPDAVPLRISDSSP